MPDIQGMQIARRSKQDDFYTSYEDIEKEISGYPVEYWKGKSVYLPCDGQDSNFFRYFRDNFERLGLSRLTASTIESKVAYEVEKSEYGPMECYTELSDFGDFRSQECRELMEACDVVVTNPPFSLWRQFFTQCLEMHKQFLILGNQNAITYNEVFPFLQDGSVWYGHSIHSGDREFEVPDNYPLEASNARTDADGRSYVRVKGVRWFTNIQHGQQPPSLVLSGKYAPEDFDTFDHLPNVINVPKTADIPIGYTGLMGVPITYFDKHDPDCFEILDRINRYCVNDYLKTNEVVRAARSHSCSVNGKVTYTRLLIRAAPQH